MAIRRPSKRFLLMSVAIIGVVGLGASAATMAHGYSKERWRARGEAGWSGAPSHMAAGMPIMMREADTDDDGTISRAEADAFMAARAKAVDADGDGKITAAEVEAYRDKRRQERMAERLKAFDADGDGVVSVAEFEKAQTWRLARADRNGDGRIERGEMMPRGDGGHGRFGGHRMGHERGPESGPRGDQGPRGQDRGGR